MKHKYHIKGIDRKAIRKSGMKPLPSLMMAKFDIKEQTEIFVEDCKRIYDCKPNPKSPRKSKDA